MDQKKTFVCDGRNSLVLPSESSTSKKKDHVVEDGDYCITGSGDENTNSWQLGSSSVEADAEAIIINNSKKKKNKAAKHKEEDEDKVAEQDEDDVPAIVFTGKKKSKFKKTVCGFSSSAFDLLNEDNIDDDEEPSVDGDNEKDSVKKDGDKEPPVIATGKKKSSKSSKKGKSSLFASSGFDILDEGDAETKEESKLDEEVESVISFTGKKKSSKSSKKSSNLFSAALLDEDDNTTNSLGGNAILEDEDVPAITFSGKKKSLKSKKNNGSLLVNELSSSAGIGEDNTETEQHSLKDDTHEADVKASVKLSDVPPAETSKSKKKKKKSGRTAQEEDDLDKILAELGEVPAIPKPTAPLRIEENVQVEPEPVGSVDATGEEKEAEADTGESAAAKKKKKKKEKEKEKKAAAASAVESKQEETKSKKPDKKFPRHVIEMQEALQRRKELEERMRREEEEKERREEEERLRQEELKKQAEEAKRRKKEKEKERMLIRKHEGKPITRKQKNEARRLELIRNQFLTQKSKSAPAKENGGAYNLQLKEMNAAKSTNTREVDSTASGGGVPQHLECEDVKRKKDAAAKREAQTMEVPPKRGEDNLRSPICCIMGHVDTGKTKLLDCIRGTNVQEGEAGGITQQIGATYFPAENIRERTRELKADAKLRVPGLLVIDTPGHESFTNLRSRGSGLCDIAILVVDIMHGLERQTIESLNLLKMRNTEFIVALNKVDRLFGWKTCKNKPIEKAMKQQSKDVQMEFNWRLTQIITQFKEQGLNTELYYKNKEMGETYSIVPTSAISGEGIPDLLLLLVKWTEKTLLEKLMFTNEIQCTVLEVKAIEGQGTTIDVVLVNGVLHEGDQIVVCGTQGPIVTTIRALLTPHPMKELRIKGSYLHHKELKAAQGVKINAQGLDHAVAGTGLYVVGPDDDVEDIKEATMQDMKSVMSRIDKSGTGVCVQASTLGSLEALLEFLKSPEVNIPVSGINIGPVHKSDVRRACAMLERNKEYATILAFDVKVTPEARELAKENGVKIFTADIIYHLFDQFQKYMDNFKEEKKREASGEAVFPCRLKILPDCVFNKKDPIVLGVNVLEGTLKTGTPICIRSDSGESEFIDIGQITSIQINHKEVGTAKKGQKVAIKIPSQKIFGKHFTVANELVSHITRESVGILKAYFQDDMGIEDWKLLEELQRDFKIDQIYF